MSTFPETTDTFREKSNRPDISYEPNRKYNLFVEDFSALESAVQAIENYLKNAANGTFTTADGKLVTIANGVIISITS
jgi:hypothetical protein